MIEQRVTLRYDAQQVPAIVQAVQGDTGRDVIFELADYEIPAGATANYYIDKPDDTAVYNSAEVISSTEILAHLTEQALAVPGRNNGQVRILADDEVITSFDFVLEVEVFRGLMRMQSDTEVNIFDQAIEDAATEAIAEAVSEIQEQTPVVTGMQNSIAPTYSSSSTYDVGDYVMYNAQLYKCKTAITTEEAWTAAHWTQVPLSDSIKNIDEKTEQILYGNGIFQFKWYQGSLTLSTGAEEDAQYAIRTGFIKLQKHCVITPFYNSSVTRTDLLLYNSDGTYSGIYIANIRASYSVGDDILKYLVRIRIINVNMQRLVPEDGDNITCEYEEYKNILDLSADVIANEMEMNGLTTGRYMFKWEKGNLALSTGAEEPAIFCARTFFHKFSQESIIHPYIDTNYSTYLLKYETDGSFVSYIQLDSDYYISDTNALYKLKLLKRDLSEIDMSITDNVYYLARSNFKLFGKKVVCFGDSITGNFKPPQNYESTLAQLSGAIVYDAGFGGCCMSDNGQARRAYAMCNLADSIASGDWSMQDNSGVTIDYAKVNSSGTAYVASGIDYVADKTEMLKSIDWSTVDYITIAYGTNDWSSDYLLDNLDDPYDVTTYLGAFRHSIETILEAYPNIRILPVTPCWRWWDQNTGASQYGDSDTVENSVSHLKLLQFADGLKEVAQKKYHLDVFDLYYNSGFNKSNRYVYFFTNDGTHPKPYGISVIGEKLYSSLIKN